MGGAELAGPVGPDGWRGAGGSRRPGRAGRWRSLSARSGHPAPTRARHIHVPLDATSTTRHDLGWVQAVRAGGAGVARVVDGKTFAIGPKRFAMGGKTFAIGSKTFGVDGKSFAIDPKGSGGRGKTFAIAPKPFVMGGKTFAIAPKRFAVHGKTFAVEPKAFAVRGKRFAVDGKPFAIFSPAGAGGRPPR